MNLYTSTGGSSTTVTVTLYKNGIATSLSVSATSSSTTGNSVTASNTLQSVSFAAGDKVSYFISSTSTSPVVRVNLTALVH